MSWNLIPDKKIIDNTIVSLQANGFDAIFVEQGQDAKKEVFKILPKSAEVMTMTSVTLDTLGISTQINESGEYRSVRQQLHAMDRKTQSLEMQKIGSAPEWSIGSVHAVTEDGHIMIASRTGSQLPAYSYGSSHVIWVVGAQKIVKDITEGQKRIFEHSLPLESVRAHKAYGVEGSKVNTILTMFANETPGRINIILVNDVLGF